MRTYKLYLIRHGLTAANYEGRYVGSTDPDLCEAGVTELLSLKQDYEYPNVARVYSSPLRRCVETSRLIYPGLTPVTVEELRECGLGVFEGKTIAELDGTEEYQEWLTSKKEYAPRGGESMSAFRQRVVLGVDRVIRDMMSDGVSEAALISHAGVLSALLTECGLPQRPATDWLVEAGKGYTFLVNASLWASSHFGEIFTPIPYGWNKENVMLDYQRELEYE